MAFVDENYVRSFFEQRTGLTGVTFKAEEPEDESVDGNVKVFRGDKELPYGLQVGCGYVSLNEYLYKENGDLYGMRQHEIRGVQQQDLLAVSATLDYLVLEHERAQLAAQPG